MLVVGNARYPGTYTISSLSTLVNAIFASGGPTPQGSLRHIQVRRDGATITDFDFYDLLIKGDKSKDVRLQPGDVLYIPPVGPLAAISGSVNTPAIYELKGTSTLSDLIEIAGGMSSLADTGKITIERLVDHQSRKTLEFPYDDSSRIDAASGWRYRSRAFDRPEFSRYGHAERKRCESWTIPMEARDAGPRPDSECRCPADPSLLAGSRCHRQWASYGVPRWPESPKHRAMLTHARGECGHYRQARQQSAANAAQGANRDRESWKPVQSSDTDSSGVTYVPCEPGEQVRPE